MTFRATLRQYFLDGHDGDQDHIAFLFGVKKSTVRATISLLRSEDRLRIAKIVPTYNPNRSVYTLVNEPVQVKRGRPAHNPYRV